MLSGGGTGGHITPIVTVASKLKQMYPSVQTVYVGERRSKFVSLTKNSAAFNASYQIFSGKFRRYHGESLLQRMVDVRTILLNGRDVVYVALGILQAVYILMKERPDVVFLKGGYVGVPVGLAAVLWRIPIVTHDSDAVAGLANRVVSRWAKVHATAQEPENYPYDAKKTRQVGVIINEKFSPVSDTKKLAYKKQLGYHTTDQLVLITGGSSGASFINELADKTVPSLLEKNPSLHVIHQAGAQPDGLYSGYSHPRLKVVSFLDDLHEWSGAADVIVMRAGANTLAEFGSQGKACIVIPGPHLAGGHQVANARYLDSQDAIVCMEQDTANEYAFSTGVQELLDNKKLQHSLSQSIRTHTKTNAASLIADILVKETKVQR